MTTGLIGTHLDIYPRRVIAEKFLSYCNVQLHADCDANPVSKGRLRFDEIFQSLKKYVNLSIPKDTSK